MTQILTVERIDCEHLLGTFLDESHYDTVIDSDCDVYYHDFSTVGNTEQNVVLKFRKGYFSDDQQRGAYDGLKDAAQPSQNRGLAAGPKGEKLLNRDWLSTEQAAILDFLSKVEVTPTLDDIEWVKAKAAKTATPRGMVWLSAEKARTGFDWHKWLNETLTLPPMVINSQVKWIHDNLISDTTYANPVDSGIAGWFGRYPRIPYGRPTAYTDHNRDQFELAYPFLRQLSKGFRDLLPVRWATQQACADKLDPSFRVPGTPFTTITVNKNFRTAAHRDAGDLATGFSNLTVVAKGNNYEGGFLILPEIRAALNIRPGDLALIANHDFIHGNTPITGDGHERISLVCYFREDMLELGSREYEDARFQFVESRRKDPSHSMARDGWNGVSADMWKSQEWYGFLEENGQHELIKQYHPEYAAQESTLESWFT